MPNPNPEPADAVGVVVYREPHGKYAAGRIFMRGTEVEIVPVTTGRSLGAASRVAANEIELVCPDLPRGKISLVEPQGSTLKVDQ